jgi:hypothetical protein
VAALVFAALDATQDDQISEQEFMELVTVLKVQWEKEETETFLERHHPKLFNSSIFQTIRKAVLNPYFQLGVYPLPLTDFVWPQFCMLKRRCFVCCTGIAFTQHPLLLATLI